MLGSLPSGLALEAFLAALDTARVGCTVIVDRDHTTLERVYSNAALASIFGVDAEGMTRIEPMQQLTAAERERLAQFRASLGPGSTGSMSIETSIVRADGVTVPLDIALTYVPLDGARATFVFVRDISAKVAMEEALRESEERFRSVAEVSPDSITVVVDKKFVYANPVALRHLGLGDVEQLATIDPMSLTPPNMRAKVAEHMTRLAAGESLPPIEYRVRGPDGRVVVFETSSSITAMNGRRAVISYTRDITERVRLQAELMKQDRLASIGTLAAGVAHELNNPLTSLGIQVKRLRRDADKLALPEETREAIAQIEEATSRMTSIIGDLLFMARPAETPQAYVDLAKIIQSTVSLLRAGARDLEVDVDLPQLPPVSGYAPKLGQVLFNVLRNAAQAIETQANGRIEVRAEVRGAAVHVTVHDNGPGIAPEVLPRVMHPFFTTKLNGTGLGLWISQALMADHRGTIDITSPDGGGTLVTLQLPLDARS